MANDQSGKLSQVACIKGGILFREDQLSEGDLFVEGKRVVNQFNGDLGITIDAADCYVIPGLIDLHFHGAAGADISDGDLDGLHTMAAHLAKRGVTSICPATMTLSFEQLSEAAKSACAFAPKDNESDLVGINMEGPYISPSKVGAQNPEYVRNPDVEEFLELQKLSGGLFKIVDIAPEVEGADEFIEKLSSDVRISIAHTCTDYDICAHAFDLGAKHITHLYNAMDPMHHRNPGPIPAAAERSDITAEIITDGIHIHPAMVRLAFNIFSDDRMILVSDTLRACGLKDGVYDLGGQDVTVKGYEARIDNGALAGSVSDLMRCLYVAVKDMDIPIKSALKATTINPAKALGIDHDYGTLDVGKIANVVLLDKDTFEIKHIVLRGKLLI